MKTPQAVQTPNKASKQPFTPLGNLLNHREESSRMAFRRQICDQNGTDSSLMVGAKLSTSNGGNIKDKISLWENKESTHSLVTSSSLSQSSSAKRTESLTESNNRTTEKPSADRGACTEKQDLGKENLGKPGSLRPCSPAEPGKCAVNEKTLGSKETSTADLRPCSPSAAEKQQVVLTITNKRAAEQTSVEKRAVFTLFKKLETLSENSSKAPPELGNYFCPPSKDKNVETKRKDSESLTRTSGAQGGKEHQENVYTEPGALPINPVPKPRRTFQHPMGISRSGESRGQRNLPPLPSTSAKTSSKPPSGFYGVPKSNRSRYKDKCPTLRRILALLLYFTKFIFSNYV